MWILFVGFIFPLFRNDWNVDTIEVVGMLILVKGRNGRN